MKCPRCQHENRPGAEFCEECAAPLARACANCGAQLSATAKFCSECAHPAGPAAPPKPQRLGAPEAYTPKHLAEKILTSKAALEGERDGRADCRVTIRARSSAIRFSPGAQVDAEGSHLAEGR